VSTRPPFQDACPLKQTTRYYKVGSVRPLCGEIQAERLGPETPAFLLFVRLEKVKKTSGLPPVYPYSLYSVENFSLFIE
jgi:hypothetical protein